MCTITKFFLDDRKQTLYVKYVVGPISPARGICPRMQLLLAAFEFPAILQPDEGERAESHFKIIFCFVLDQQGDKPKINNKRRQIQIQQTVCACWSNLSTCLPASVKIVTAGLDYSKKNAAAAD